MDFIVRNARWIRWLLTKVPIYGQLLNSSWTSVKASLHDLLITTLFSLLPLWFYPTIVKFGFGTPFWATVKSFVNGGELFIYSAALVGPLIYAITKKYGEERNQEGDEPDGVFPKIPSIQFPYGVWFVLISILVCCFAAIFFGIMRANTEANLPVQPDEDSLFIASGFLYLFTLSCFFCVSVYRLNLENTPREFGRDTRNLMDQWEQRHD
ncbi:hypothetical protein JF546_17320 [Nitratireductor aquimarinus]|uniref:hypothetical protein n=1 Tax=Nitratireductor aquimarinus TaxID=889300 RepID=UPI001A8E6BCB|nr:hypothetical protein [Nitratireductor aquimarinus]MBN8244777.1 hypothetical protein [Nitratireductor aquimarinus]MBY6133164.1 hypothetical protein [Nitratireductor aquimarinus]MCA1303470.1 hypothetical protein [Nitratireductor aquimarinus]